MTQQNAVDQALALFDRMMNQVNFSLFLIEMFERVWNIIIYYL